VCKDVREGDNRDGRFVNDLHNHQLTTCDVTHRHHNHHHHHHKQQQLEERGRLDTYVNSQPTCTAVTPLSSRTHHIFQSPPGLSH